MTMEVIHGPTAPLAGTVIYQVTLASGMIVTNPAGFGVERPSVPAPDVVVTESGQVLRKRPDADHEQSEEYKRFEAMMAHIVSVPKEEIDARRGGKAVAP